MMRALVVHNVLARREGLSLFVPVNPASDPDGDRVASLLVRVWRLAAGRPEYATVKSSPLPPPEVGR